MCDNDITIEVLFNGEIYKVCSVTIHESLDIEELNTILEKSVFIASGMKDNLVNENICGFPVTIVKTIILSDEMLI
jgi:hypothetical protein